MEMNINGLLIPVDPGQPVENVTITGLQSLTDAVGGYVELLHVDGREDLVMYINEEGKIHGLPFNARATALMAPRLFAGDVIVGPAVIVAMDDEGDDQTVPETDRQQLLDRLTV